MKSSCYITFVLNCAWDSLRLIPVSWADVFEDTIQTLDVARTGLRTILLKRGRRILHHALPMETWDSGRGVVAPILFVHVVSSSTLSSDHTKSEEV